MNLVAVQDLLPRLLPRAQYSSVTAVFVMMVLVAVDIQTSVLSCLDQSNAAVLLRESLCAFCSKKRRSFSFHQLTPR